MKLTQEEGNEVVWEDSEDWVKIESNIVDQRRWVTVHEGIFEHIPSGKFYQMSWECGSTEQQYQKPFEYNDPELTEVHQVEKTIKVWESIQ